MRTLLIISFILISNIVYGQHKLRDSVYIKTDLFEIIYSEKLEQPRYVKYNVKCPYGTASRTGMDFYTCDSIKTSDNKDYEKNIYDKGHMLSSANCNCSKELMFKTFTYLNCALQHEKLNRGVWKYLEIHERDLMDRNKSVTVEILCVYTLKSIKLPTGATVPDGFYKTIRYGKDNVEKYYFKNEEPKSDKYLDYKIK